MAYFSETLGDSPSHKKGLFRMFPLIKVKYSLHFTVDPLGLFKSTLLLIACASLTFGDTFHNWHVRDSGGKSVSRIVYSGELFVAVGLSGAVLTSSDGVNWTARDSGTTNALTSLTCGNGVFLASGFVNGGYVLYRSTNGIDWAQVQWPSYELISGLGFAEGKLLLFQPNGAVCERSSPDSPVHEWFKLDMDQHRNTRSNYA